MLAIAFSALLSALCARSEQHDWAGQSAKVAQYAGESTTGRRSEIRGSFSMGCVGRPGPPAWAVKGGMPSKRGTMWLGGQLCARATPTAAAGLLLGRALALRNVGDLSSS